jgi:membrane-associated phospholipid phosphatase
MLLWSGFALLLGGLASFAVDRRAAHSFHDIVNRRAERLIYRTTDWAKGLHWLAAAVLAYVLAWLAEQAWGLNAVLQMTTLSALAFLASLTAGSLILHTLKTILGRRRPRDELELGLYGFNPFGLNFRYDSFPSGHALTIFCVAVILSGTVPWLAPLWFAIALYLALTRALLNAHFLSDVFIGASIGLLTAREVVIHLFPSLTQPWF